LTAEREKDALVAKLPNRPADLGQALGDQILVLVPARAGLLMLDLGAGGRLEADQGDDQHRHDQGAELLPVQHAGPLEAGQPAGRWPITAPPASAKPVSQLMKPLKPMMKMAEGKQDAISWPASASPC
jgi:hypothetical protein